MTNKVIDHYSLELEMSSEHEGGLPVRCIATNTDDLSAAEAWLTLEKTRALLNFAYGRNRRSLIRVCNSLRTITMST